MVSIDSSSKELDSWNKDVQLLTDEDIATVLQCYEKCLISFKPEDIHGIVERDGFYACVVNEAEPGSFDLFEWLNGLYTCNSSVKINCANARFLFPSELSRGEFKEEAPEVDRSGTGDLDDSGEESATGFWDEEEESIPRYVIHVAMGTKVPIDDEDGVIFGRSSAQSDYPISNDVVSRIHCRVYLKDGRYMVEDKRSKYGTFINNLKVLPGKDREIKPGDILRMANEEFKFV